MADKDLTLRLRLNWSDASRESRRFHAEEQARIDQFQAAYDRHFKKGTEGANQQASAMARMGGAAERAGQAVQGMALGYAGLGAAMGGIRLIGDVIANVSANAVKSGEASFDLENKLRALAALTGKTAPGQTVRDVIGYSMKTGMSIDEAERFQQAFFGSSPAGLQKGNVTQEILDEAVVQAGIMSKRQGGEAKPRGDLAGVLGQLAKYSPDKRTAVVQMMSDLERTRVALGEGRGEDPELTKSLLNLAGSNVGPGKMFATVPELASHLGTQSLSAAGLMSDVRTEQLIRAFSGTTPEVTKFLHDWAGVEETDDMEKRLAKIMPALGREKAKGRTIPGFMKEHGFNFEMQRAATELYEVYDVQKARLATTRGGVGLTPEQQEAARLKVGEQVLAENAAFMAAPGGRMGAADPALEGAKAISGEKFQDWTQVKKWAKAAWYARSKHLSLNEGFKGIVAGVLRSGNPFSGEEARHEEMALETLEAQVKAAGLTGVVNRRTAGMLGNWEAGGAEKGFFMAEPHERGRIMAEELRRARIVPGAPLEKEIQDLLKEQNGMIKEDSARAANAPGPVLNAKPTNAVGRSPG